MCCALGSMSHPPRPLARRSPRFPGPGVTGCRGILLWVVPRTLPVCRGLDGPPWSLCSLRRFKPRSRSGESSLHVDELRGEGHMPRAAHHVSMRQRPPCAVHSAACRTLRALWRGGPPGFQAQGLRGAVGSFSGQFPLACPRGGGWISPLGAMPLAGGGLRPPLSGDSGEAWPRRQSAQGTLRLRRDLRGEGLTPRATRPFPS